MNIFDSAKIKNVVFKNRVVMAPMVAFRNAGNPSGDMSDTVLQHYLLRASNGM